MNQFGRAIRAAVARNDNEEVQRILKSLNKNVPVNNLYSAVLQKPRSELDKKYGPSPQVGITRLGEY